MARLAGSNPTRAALSAFHVSIDPGTESGDKLGSSGAGTTKRVARISVEDSNRLFAEFADWNEIFKDVSLDRLAEFDDPANDAPDSDEIMKKALGGDHD